MARMIALVDRETGLGFRLAGMEARTTETVDEMKRSVEALLAEGGADVALLDESLFHQAPEPLKRRIEESVAPIFVLVPTFRLRRERVTPEEYVARLIRRAIGYQIKIRR